MRAFVGVRIEPNEEVRELLSFLSKQDGVKVVNEDNLHVNLKFFGEISEKQAEEIEKVIKKINSPRFSVLFDGIGFFPSEEFIKVVFVKARSKELMKINEFLENDLYSKGFMKENKLFVPHLTLARVKKRLPEEVVNKLKNWRVNFSCEVSEVELIKSVLKEGGPLYETIFKIDLKWFSYERFIVA